MAETIKLTVGTEKQKFEIPRPVAEMSVTLKGMVEEGFTNDGQSIPLNDISPETMNKIVEFCTYRHATPYTEEELKDPRSLDFLEKEGNYDRGFIDMEKDPLIQLTLAANYLDIKPLLDLCCKKIAYMIKKCKDPAEICSTFGIEPDQTDAELKKIREETDWTAE